MAFAEAPVAAAGVPLVPAAVVPGIAVAAGPVAALAATAFGAAPAPGAASAGAAGSVLKIQPPGVADARSRSTSPATAPLVAGSASVNLSNTSVSAPLREAATVPEIVAPEARPSLCAAVADTRSASGGAAAAPVVFGAEAFLAPTIGVVMRAAALPPAYWLCAECSMAARRCTPC